LLKALKAGHELQGWEKLDQAKQETTQGVISALQQAIYSVREFNRLEAHRDRVTDISFSPDGKILASVSADNTLKLWNVILVRSLAGHDRNVWSVSFSPNGKTLASASLDSTINLWNIDDGTLLQTLKRHRHWLTSVSFSPDGKTLASTSSDQIVKLWKLNLNIEDLIRLGCHWLTDDLTTHPQEE